MASMNRVYLMGNLTRDPQLRQTSSGTSVADIGLAISDSYRNKAGEMVEQTCFVDVVVWGRQAETCAEYLFKGSPALVEGRLQLDSWENQQGEKRSKLLVRADRVQFLGSPRGGGGGGGGGGNYESAPPSRPPRDDSRAAPPPASSGAASGLPGDDDDLPF